MSKSITQLLDGLWDIYQLETWHEEKLSKEELEAYHRTLIENGQIITISDNDLLVGYVEFFLYNGCCFINNLFIRPGYRNNKAIWKMRNRLFEVCGKAKVYFGSRNKNNRKYTEFQLRSQHGK